MKNQQSFPIVRQWSCTKYGLGIQDKFEKNGTMYVQGYIYNSKRYEDGEYVVLGPIDSLSNDYMLSTDGSQYKLEGMADGYEL